MAVDVGRSCRCDFSGINARGVGSNAGRAALERDRGCRHSAEGGIDLLHARGCKNCPANETGAGGLRMLWDHAAAGCGVASPDRLTSAQCLVTIAVWITSPSWWKFGLR